MTMLHASGLAGGYGGAQIPSGCTVAARAGEATVIVGPNGAGKSTALRALFGMLRPDAGDVVFEGRSVAAQLTQDRVRGAWCSCRSRPTSSRS